MYCIRVEGLRLRSCALLLSLVLVHCARPAPHLQPGAHAGTTQVAGQTWSVCLLLGPSANRPGIYGSDLGITVSMPDNSSRSGQQAILFGDTWAEADDACRYPLLKSDDLQAYLPLARPVELGPGQPASSAANACSELQYTLNDSSTATSFRRLRLYKSSGDRTDANLLDTGMLRTPVAAWSDGAHLFGDFVRDEVANCKSSQDCPAQMVCTSDPGYAGKHIGACQPHVSLPVDGAPQFCRDNGDCPPASLCADLDQGVCVATEAFHVERDGQRLTPGWYDDDPRRGVALNMYLASAFWPDRPEDYATGFRFTTNKFINPSARTVTHFDPSHPDENDYTPGTETLLLWGRPTFAATRGWQAFMFLLYQPLAGLLDADGTIHWSPHYFAGYDADGQPRWSDVEADAVPVYGVDENLELRNERWTFNWKDPEFDYVNQNSISWVDSLQRWVLLYGGDAPSFTLQDPASGKPLPPVHAQSVPGAIYLRSAAHPWGRATAADEPDQGFSAASPVLTRKAAAKYLACDEDSAPGPDCTPQDHHKQPGDLLSTLAQYATQMSPGDFLSITASCIGGTAALDTQYSLGDDSSGHLYGSNIIEAWTQDVSDEVTDLAPGERAAELYWDVSTWNPYQVVLVKTRLRGQPGRPLQ